ncbi:MAG: PKD domain-containing protein [Fibromonadaceae bacterium]|jgi:hypothetical protein|nr:PKD domain-containing protein [Fibromonadaceae bacterium]
MPIILLFLFLTSCSSDFIYGEPTTNLSVEINSNSSTGIVLVGDTVRFQAKINPDPSYAKNFFWTLNAQRNPFLQFSHIFNSQGSYLVTFHVEDRLGDILSESLVITVSPP